MNDQYRLHTFWIAIIGLILFSSCDIIDSLKKDKDEGNEEGQVEFIDGISRDILNFLSAEDLVILEDTLGVQIYRGNNPPNINGTYRMSPVLLNKSNVPNDHAKGHRFADVFLKFYSQNDELFTIELDKVDTNPTTGETMQTSVGVSSYLIGDGNDFSVFSKVHSKLATGEESILLLLYTGILTENGVRNLQSALLMLDNKGHDIFIKNGAGRSFIDGDGFSELAEFPVSKIAISLTKKGKWISENYAPVHKN